MAQNESLARLATDLPKLLLEYKLAMAQMGSQEAHEMAMLQAKMGYETSITDEKEKLADVLAVIGAEHEKISGERQSTEQNIIRLQEDIHKAKLQIEGLNVAIPKINKEEQTADIYKLSADIEAMTNEPRKFVLKNEIDIYNKKRNEEATLIEHRNQLEGVFSKLTGLQLIGETQVAPDLAGEKTLTQSDDFATYFDNVLTQQIDPKTQLPYTDDVFAGNSTRFDPNDDMTSYYRKVFVESFSPSVVQQQKELSISANRDQIAFANYLARSKDADGMLAQAKSSLLSAVYYTNDKGKLQTNKGLQDDQPAYENAEAYIKKQLPNASSDFIETEILKAIELMRVTKATTLMRALTPSKRKSVEENAKAQYQRKLLESLGLKAVIDEMEIEVDLANILLQPVTLSSPGFTLPPGTTPDPLKSIIGNMPD